MTTNARKMATTGEALKVGQRVTYIGTNSIIPGRVIGDLGDGICSFRPEGHTEGGWAVYANELLATSKSDAADFGRDWTCDAHGDGCTKYGLDWDCVGNADDN